MQPVFSLKDGQKPGVLCREGCKGYIAFTDRDAGTGGGIKKTAGGGLFSCFFISLLYLQVGSGGAGMLPHGLLRGGIVPAADGVQYLPVTAEDAARQRQLLDIV